MSRVSWARWLAGGSVVVIAVSAASVLSVDTAGSKPGGQYEAPVRVAALPPPLVVTTAQVPNAPVVRKPAESGVTLASLDAVVNSATGNPTADRWFEGGDKIKLLVYERLPEAELNKYGRNGFSENDFQQRTEMSGEFPISSEETLSIPMLGTFSVTGSTPQQLEAALSTAYEQRMGRPGFVTITAVTRPPVLVLGPVKTPGKVDYQPNMTVVHALALAGGIKSVGGDDEPWQKMEVVRERMTNASARQEIAKLYVQRIVLEAEKDQVEPQPSVELVDLVGATRAKAMIATERERRLAIVYARSQQLGGIEQQLAAAKQQVATLEKTNFAQYDQTVTLAQQRVDGFERLAANRNANNLQVLQAKTDYEQAKARRDEVLNRLTDAKQAIGRLMADKALLTKTAQSEVATALQAVRQQIDAAEERSETSENMLRAIRGPGLTSVSYSGEPGQQGPHWVYKVVRTSHKGPVEFPAEDLTVLAPGDLVKVELDTGGGSAAQTVPHIQRDPAVPQDIKNQGQPPAKRIEASVRHGDR